MAVDCHADGSVCLPLEQHWLELELRLQDDDWDFEGGATVCVLVRVWGSVGFALWVGSVVDVSSGKLE